MSTDLFTAEEDLSFLKCAHSEQRYGFTVSDAGEGGRHHISSHSGLKM
jgi:hypothetical protein